MLQNDLFVSKVRDACRISNLKSVPKYLGFLDSAQLNTAVSVIKNEKANYCIFGGHSECERNFICVLPDWMEAENTVFPIKAIKFTFNDEYKLSHRDFLGALMSLGIKREVVGDIFVYDGVAFAFVAENIADYLVTEISKVGSVGVKVQICDNPDISATVKYDDRTQTVSSLRLDCAVSAVCGVGRKAAVGLIESGFVSVNNFAIAKTVYAVKQGDKISVRKYGKFLIDDCSGATKKQRVILNYKKYV